MVAPPVGFIKELLSDDHSRWDIGYVCLAVLVVLILGTIPVILGSGVVQQVYDTCALPPAPDCREHRFPFAEVGKAIALITGAFGSPLLALAGYVVALKRQTMPLPADAVPPPVDAAKAPAVHA